MWGNFIVWAVSSFWVIKTFSAFSVASEIKLLMRHVGSTASTVAGLLLDPKTPKSPQLVGGFLLLLSFTFSLTSPFSPWVVRTAILNSLHPMYWVCSPPQKRAGRCAETMCPSRWREVSTQRFHPGPPNSGFRTPPNQVVGFLGWVLSSKKVWDPSKRNLWEVMVLSYVSL